MSKKQVTMANVAEDVPDPTPAPETPSADPARPDWLLSKYNSVEEQAKAYVDLQKTFGALKGAPEEYDYGDMASEIDLDNQHVKEFQLWAKENRLSQDAYAKTWKTFVEYQKSKRPDPDVEIAKLGPNGIEMVKTVQNWAKNTLSPEEYAGLEAVPVDARFIKMLDGLRQRHVHTMSRVPNDNTMGQDFKKETREEVESEMEANYKRYTSDAVYRAQLQQRFAQAVGE